MCLWPIYLHFSFPEWILTLQTSWHIAQLWQQQSTASGRYCKNWSNCFLNCQTPERCYANAWQYKLQRSQIPKTWFQCLIVARLRQSLTFNTGFPSHWPPKPLSYNLFEALFTIQLVKFSILQHGEFFKNGFVCSRADAPHNTHFNEWKRKPESKSTRM